MLAWEEGSRPRREVQGRTPEMNEHDESDSPIVPEKRANKPPRGGAECVEGRRLAKGNPTQHDADRTQSRPPVRCALERIRKAARRDRRLKFTALLHHVYDVDRLRASYRSLRRDASAGIDGVTWEQYGQDLERNLEDLSGRLKRGAYRARPTRRVTVPKSDGRPRLIGVMALEDKVVQRATVTVLQCIYEEDFLGFSYGFRPGRNPHMALDAVSAGIRKRKVGWVLDADLRGFFDTLDHGWLVKFLEHRIADQRVLRLIQKWLSAGVMEDGKRTRSEVGAVQGGSISPLLANIYLHYVWDLWSQRWRKRAEGEVILVRYADDFVAGFQSKALAERYLEEVTHRFEHFGLQLHANKTRLIEFGRFAATSRAQRGEGKPETFDFLGLTHVCGKTREGRWFHLQRRTMRQRRQAKLKEVHHELRRRMHDPVPEQGRYLASVVRGHAHYYGIPGNSRAVAAFRYQVIRMWRKTLSRRSQKGGIPWSRMGRLVERHIPKVRLKYTNPDGHLASSTRGRSPVR